MIWWDGETWVVGDKIGMKGGDRNGYKEPWRGGSELSMSTAKAKGFPPRRFHRARRPPYAFMLGEPNAGSGLHVSAFNTKKVAAAAIPKPAPKPAPKPMPNLDDDEVVSVADEAPGAWSSPPPTPAPQQPAQPQPPPPSIGSSIFGRPRPDTPETAAQERSREERSRNAAAPTPTPRAAAPAPPPVPPPAPTAVPSSTLVQPPVAMDSDELAQRVAEAKANTVSVSEAGAVEKRVQEIMKRHFDEWASDKIDTAELERRKASAPKQAAAELQSCTALDEAFDAYAEAVRVREMAWEQYGKAAGFEEAAAKKVLKELAALEAESSS